MTEWEVLARGNDGVGVSRCPAGHIHLEVEGGEFTLRFDEARFLAFARTVAAAVTTMSGHDSASPEPIQHEGRQWRN